MSSMEGHDKKMAANQEEGPPQRPDLLPPGAWTSQPEELEELKPVVEPTRAVVFCESGPDC